MNINLNSSAIADQDRFMKSYSQVKMQVVHASRHRCLEDALGSMVHAMGSYQGSLGNELSKYWIPKPFDTRNTGD